MKRQEVVWALGLVQQIKAMRIPFRAGGELGVKAGGENLTIKKANAGKLLADRRVQAVSSMSTE